MGLLIGIEATSDHHPFIVEAGSLHRWFLLRETSTIRGVEQKKGRKKSPFLPCKPK